MKYNRRIDDDEHDVQLYDGRARTEDKLTMCKLVVLMAVTLALLSMGTGAFVMMRAKTLYQRPVGDCPVLEKGMLRTSPYEPRQGIITRI